MKELMLKGYNNDELLCRVWDDISAAKGVVLIIHGMQEHGARYAHFANYLNTNGYIVYASDLRAHGKTCPNVAKLGQTDGNLFNEIVADQLAIMQHIQLTHELPLHLLGHSFGSFITQKIMQESSAWETATLSGTAYTKTPTVALGLVVANITAALKGKHAHAKMVESLSFGAYAKRFEHGYWLTRDEEICKQYYADPYCGTPFPAGFYQSMFKNMLMLPKGFKFISKNKAILIIAGASDPVGNNGKLPQRLHNKFLSLGLNSTLKLIENARHEVLNETNRNEVYAEILAFIGQKRLVIK